MMINRNGWSDVFSISGAEARHDAQVRCSEGLLPSLAAAGVQLMMVSLLTQTLVSHGLAKSSKMVPLQDCSQSSSVRSSIRAPNAIRDPIQALLSGLQVSVPMKSSGPNTLHPLDLHHHWLHSTLAFGVLHTDRRLG